MLSSAWMDLRVRVLAHCRVSILTIGSQALVGHIALRTQFKVNNILTLRVGVGVSAFIDSDSVRGEPGFSKCLFHPRADFTTLTFHFLSCSSFLEALFIFHYCFPLLPNSLGGHRAFTLQIGSENSPFNLSEVAQGRCWERSPQSMRCCTFPPPGNMFDMNSCCLAQPMFELGSLWEMLERNPRGEPACCPELAACTLEVPAGGAGQDTVLTGPWGFCSDHHPPGLPPPPRKQVYLKSEAVS